ncbi:cytochrome b561 and DOMON domain-containing protein At3g07570 [Rhodamnia argentea]|uniref:Cytochrome b561 and DOMON domain-containing protein At3g07570 n=1 Tax=Rhodamnia argentea TaxID=178133 RepID=A0A8B8R3U3_9MYRT|nr:cytochrome b561 and DOMON domain-containing protein At3g07570 [Rhodamnia argentea]XP_048138468.1 cytochrome b561 and DOMON domain-containing protein At3g07570 [Rhodamnia argentea]
MKASPSLILVLVSLCGLAAAVSSQSAASDSCSSNLNVDGIPFDTTSLTCLSAWDSENFILRYKQASASTWSFVLSAPTTSSYIAMGFSSNGRMVGSSAVVGWVSSSDGAMMKQYALEGTTAAQVMPNQGTLNLLANSSMIASQSSRLYMAFQLDAAQPESRLIYSVGPSGFTPVKSGYRLIQHQDMTSTAVNFASGQTTTQSRPYTRLRKSHGVLNMLGWSILMIIGIIVARHGKQYDPMWFYVHAAIQSSAFILGLLGIICGFVLENKISASNVSTHKGLGIFILVLGCLQVMAFLARPEKGSKVREYWNLYHHNMGRILIIFAIANVFYGIHLGEKGKQWNVGYGITIALLLVVLIVLEIQKFRK